MNFVKKFLSSLGFQGWLWLFFPVLLVMFLVVDLSGCGEAADNRGISSDQAYEDAYLEGHADGYAEGRYEGYAEGEDAGRDEGYEEGYREGATYGWMDRSQEVAEYFTDGAVEFAIEHGGMHPEEAAAIIESGGSKSEYEAASQTLYYYFMYFFNSEYE